MRHADTVFLQTHEHAFKAFPHKCVGKKNAWSASHRGWRRGVRSSGRKCFHSRSVLKNEAARVSAERSEAGKWPIEQSTRNLRKKTSTWYAQVCSISNYGFNAEGFLFSKVHARHWRLLYADWELSAASLYTEQWIHCKQKRKLQLSFNCCDKFARGYGFPCSSCEKAYIDMPMRAYILPCATTVREGDVEPWGSLGRMYISL